MCKNTRSCFERKHNPLCSIADQSDNHQDTEVKVFFPAEKKEMDAYPGASLAIVAQKCGVDIQYGCHTGACGVCEVELRQYEPTGESLRHGS